MNEIEQHKDIERSLKLFTYLRELAKLRSIPVRNVEKYEEVLWLKDIPREHGCKCWAWSAEDEEITDKWIEIRRPELPKAPPLPLTLRDIVASEYISNYRAVPETPKEVAESGLTAHWNDYLEGSWLRWAAERERLLPLNRAYGKLHSIFQYQKREPETYELILGIGLLCWQTHTGETIRRHLITSNVELTLRESDGVLMVGPTGEAGGFKLEQDMLETDQLPEFQDRNQISSEIESQDDDVLREAVASSLLKKWLFLVSRSGVYSGTLEMVTGTQQDPRVHFAPAIILRRRTQQSLVTCYEKIIDRIGVTGSIPPGVRRLVSISEGDHGFAEGGEMTQLRPEEYLLPLAANDQQRRIVERATNAQGLLVKGPPGTGKSHTIANVICHLLASGKRILVTSQAPRALQVLKSFLPKEVRPLCVSLLGKDQESLKELEASVQAITSKLSMRGSGPQADNIAKTQERLKSLYSRKADLEFRLREYRGREVNFYNLCDGKYSGTAQSIAERLEKRRPEYSWFRDLVPASGEVPINAAEIKELLESLRYFDEIETEELSLEIPLSSSLVESNEFSNALAEEKQLRRKYEEKANSVNLNSYRGIGELPRDKVSELLKILRSYEEVATPLLNHPQSWVAAAAREAALYETRKWNELSARTQDTLAGMQPRLESFEKVVLNLPSGYSRAEITVRFTGVLELLKRGRGFGIPLFRPKAVRQCWDILSDARIDGERLRTKGQFEAALGLMKLEDDLAGLWRLWSGIVPTTEGPFRIQVAALEDLNSLVERVLGLAVVRERSQESIAALGLQFCPEWHSTAEVERLISALEGRILEFELESCENRISSMGNALKTIQERPSAHPVVGAMLDAIENRSDRDYRSHYGKIRELGLKKERWTACQSSLGKLRTVLKELSNDMEASFRSSEWDVRLTRFNDALAWAQASSWLSEYITDVNSEDLVNAHSDVQDSISKTLAELVALLAWSNCLDNLNERKRQYLEAWARAIGRIGRGTGKRTHIHREHARQYMEECKGAIPGYIMPLYRVAESFEPVEDSFDVAIIDEASQSGPDALFLFFVARQVFVVGDDNQITPSEVGVERSSVDRLTREYLSEVERSAEFGLDGSLFGLASIIFPDKVILTEHFRCMHEIIQFSNELCYSDTPLEPLRKPPAHPLTPIMTVHVRDGYVRGSSSNSVNEPEAAALVTKIRECCENEAYRNKTMGVISLLGKSQAREIENRLLEAVGPKEMLKRRIVCGDAYSFQGDERDVIFLSMVAAPGEKPLHAVTAPQYERRFNVAASRARDQVWLFHTPTLNDFRNKECLRYRLLSYYMNPKFPTRFGSRSDCQSQFERDVYDEIVARGYKVIPQYEVAGYFIDMVVEGSGGKSLAVECDGDIWHESQEARDNDLRRQRVLERCGWRFWRVWGSAFYHDRKKALQSLWSELESMGINESSDDAPPSPEEEVNRAAHSSEIASEVEEENRLSVDLFGYSEQQDVPSGKITNAVGSDLKQLSGKEIQSVILEVLKNRPKNSCKKDDVTKHVCSYLKVRTRGKPLREFNQRVMMALRSLAGKGQIQVYKAKNVRVKLHHPGGQEDLL